MPLSIMSAVKIAAAAAICGNKNHTKNSFYYIRRARDVNGWQFEIRDVFEKNGVKEEGINEICNVSERACDFLMRRLEKPGRWYRLAKLGCAKELIGHPEYDVDGTLAVCPISTEVSNLELLDFLLFETYFYRSKRSGEFYF